MTQPTIADLTERIHLHVVARGAGETLDRALCQAAAELVSSMLPDADGKGKWRVEDHRLPGPPASFLVLRGDGLREAFDASRVPFPGKAPEDAAGTLAWAVADALNEIERQEK